MTLKNSGDSATITLPQDIDGEIRIRLAWTKDSDSGFLQRILGGDSVDLDLGCYYELANGDRTLIDCLQFAPEGQSPRSACSKQGCYDNEPFIWHTGDNTGRNGDSAEEILVNPAGIGQIKRIIAYTYIFDGPASWDAFNAKLTLIIPGCEDVCVDIEGDDSKRRFCAIMHIEVSADGKSVTATKLDTFHLGHSDCDRAYGWGLQYRQ